MDRMCRRTLLLLIGCGLIIPQRVLADEGYVPSYSATPSAAEVLAATTEATKAAEVVEEDIATGWSNPLVPHRSWCTLTSLVEEERLIASVAGTIRVEGTDNKGGIKGYRLELSDQTYENQTGEFEVMVATPGAYIAKGYVLDTKDKWVGGADKCEYELKVVPGTLVEQPDTGVPTWWWGMMLFGLLSVGLTKGQQRWLRK